jgi:enoyl-CoA hydratase
MSVDVSQTGDIAVLTLNRPEKLNALSFAVLKQIDAALDQVKAMPVRALVVTGAGEKSFCAGADIEELRGRSLQAQLEGAQLGQAVFAKLGQLPFVSIAAINGYAFGGGLELALACTFRVGVRRAKFGLPEIKLGLIPGYGGTQRLPRMIGEARAMELILSGRTVEAEEAERIGLLNRLVDDNALAAALAFAAEFTSYGLLAQRFARTAVSVALDNPVAEGLKIEAQLSTMAYRTQDAEEGMAAFAQKRKPVFRDA